MSDTHEDQTDVEDSTESEDETPTNIVLDVHDVYEGTTSQEA